MSARLERLLSLADDVSRRVLVEDGVVASLLARDRAGQCLELLARFGKVRTSERVVLQQTGFRRFVVRMETGTLYLIGGGTSPVAFGDCPPCGPQCSGPIWGWGRPRLRFDSVGMSLVAFGDSRCQVKRDGKGGPADV